MAISAVTLDVYSALFDTVRGPATALADLVGAWTRLPPGPEARTA